MINRMVNLKRKMETLHEEEKVLNEHSRARIKHLKDLYDIPSLTDVKYDEWARVRLNRLLVDYLLRSGYGESARALAREKEIEQLVDLDVFVQCHRIEESLRNGNTAEGLAWCAEHKPMMRKSSVCFRVLSAHLQHGPSANGFRVNRTALSSSCVYSSTSSYDDRESYWKQGSMRRSILPLIRIRIRRRYTRLLVC